MMFDVVEVAATIVTANFATAFATLAVAKTVPNLTIPAVVEKRQDAEIAVSLGALGTDLRNQVPIIGIWGKKATTQAKNQSRRHNACILVFDWYMRGADPVVMGKQTEIAAEALLQCVDLLAGAGSGIYGGGETPGSVTIDFTQGYDQSIQPNYDRRVTLTFAVQQLDTGL
jgi:hypothetical protein